MKVRYSGSTGVAWVIAVLFIGVFVVSTGIGVSQIIKEQAFLARAELDTGTITNYQVDSSGKAVVFCPIIDFNTKAGEPVTFEGGDCVSHPSEIQIGQQVQVYYDPQNPKEFQTKRGSLFDQYAAAAGFPIFFGFLFLGIALVMIVLSVFQIVAQRKQKAAHDAMGYNANWDGYIEAKNKETVRQVEARRRKQGK